MTFLASSERCPYGLMRLSDMLNCYIGQLHAVSSQLSMEMTRLSTALEMNHESGRLPAPKQERDKFEAWLNITREVAHDFELDAVDDRIKIFSRKLKDGISWQDLLAEIRVLHETIECGVTLQFVYKYPKNKSSILDSWEKDWESVRKAFPSCAQDVVAGIDCWALGHPTASVFHMMRVLEPGLRALAADLNQSFDVEVWQTVINNIEAEIRNQGKTLPRGLPRNERLKFLAEAAKEFVYFKDGWRNYVSHQRFPYDEHQARSTMEHVRTFMTVLSSTLSESNVGP